MEGMGVEIRQLAELMDKAWIGPRSQEDDGVYKGK